MADMNSTILIGRLTRDAELKYTASGAAVGKFYIAVNKRVKKGDAWEDKVSFFEIVQWGKSAESVNQYLVKGKQVAVSGELEQDRWEQDGQNKSKVYVTAHNVQLLGGQAGQGSAPAASGGPGNSQVARSEDGGDEGFADDIPF